jgi:hypothetical protein
MGRHSHGLPQNCKPRTIRLFHVRIDSGGYDDGGAYWGLGDPIYCASNDDDYFATVRASNRTHAALLLDLHPEQLRAGLTHDIYWLRYHAVRAMIGQPHAVFEIQEFGQPVGYVEDWDALCRFAQHGTGLIPYKLTKQGEQHGPNT